MQVNKTMQTANPQLLSEPIQAFFKRVCHLEHPEELFGHLGDAPDEQRKHLEERFRFFIKTYHPDKFTGQPAEQYYATEISKLIIGLKQKAKDKIQQHTYGKPVQPAQRSYASIIRTQARAYFVTELWIEGEFADIYRAWYRDPDSTVRPEREVVIKIIADPAQAALAKKEIQFYQVLSHFSLAEYIDDFVTPEGKPAIILGQITDSYDLIRLREAYQRRYHTPGLPPEHLVWILDRYLAMLGLLHQQGIIHGNLQPDNLVVQPATHNAFLIDFLHCRMAPQDSDCLEVVNPAYCGAEVLTRRFKPHPVSDIYALGRCMLYLLGVDRLDDAAGLHPRLADFLRRMIITDPRQRASDAWALAEELAHLRRLCFGASHQFIPLEIEK